MAKNLEDLMRERPGNPEVQAKHMERMLAEVRAYPRCKCGHEWRAHGDRAVVLCDGDLNPPRFDIRNYHLHWWKPCNCKEYEPEESE